MDKLTKQAEALGIKVDGRWSEDRLRSEIEEAQAALDAAEAQEKLRVEAEAKEKEEAEAQEKARKEREEQEAEAELARIEAEEKAAAQAEAQREAFQKEQSKNSVTIINLQPNPMRSLGLDGYGEAELTGVQMSDPRFAAKIERARNLGLIKVK